jgi:DivIVA domain-containing protein
MTLLTAEDVLNKKFQPTKFREGYDQDEVDDFLDDVVSTLRAVAAENEQLRADLAACQSRISELGGEAMPERVAPVAQPEPEPMPDPEPEPEPEPEVQPTQVAAPLAQAETGPTVSGEEPQSAASMLALAQRVHDEYVANGQRESERLVTEARAKAEGLVREAEDQRTATLGRLEQERVELEQKIEDLRGFERDYRSRLKTYLERLLQDVEGTEVGADGAPRSI